MPAGITSFLSLAPDTYTLTAAKHGHVDVVYPGIVIFADQTQVLAVKMPQSAQGNREGRGCGCRAPS